MEQGRGRRDMSQAEQDKILALVAAGKWREIEAATLAHGDQYPKRVLVAIQKAAKAAAARGDVELARKIFSKIGYSYDAPTTLN